MSNTDFFRCSNINPALQKPLSECHILTGYSVLNVDKVTREVELDEFNIPPNFNSTFDYTTLFYDAISTLNGATVVCPKLYNFVPIVSNSTHYLDRIRASYRIVKTPRFDIIYISNGMHFPKTWVFEYKDKAFRIRLSSSNNSLFENKKTLLTINKNNQLDWISYWLNYHHKFYGFNGLVFVDNGSSDYSIEQLYNTLLQSNIDQFILLSAALPFGPVLLNRDRSLLFYQNAMIHLCRLKFLSNSNFVLSLDIDELLDAPSLSASNISLSSIGLSRFSGEWIYSPFSEQKSHARHCYKLPFLSSSPKKYIFNPSRLGSSIYLDKHGVSSYNSLLRKTIHVLSSFNRYNYFHCHSLSSGWKGKRISYQDELVFSPSLQKKLSSVSHNEYLEMSNIKNKFAEDFNKLPDVSVVIPAFNRVNLLQRAILSCLNQSFVSLEVIVVDDFSNPPLKQLLPKDVLNSVVLVRLDEKQNAAIARNIGVTYSRAKYVSFLDSDDMFHSLHLYYGLRYLNVHPSLVYSAASSSDQLPNLIRILFIF